MLRLFRKTGLLRIPVIAVRSFRNEFLIYETDFGKGQWKDIYAHQLCALYCQPSKHHLQDLQRSLDYFGFTDYVIVETSV